MPRITTSITGSASVSTNYPQLLQGRSGSVWLITAPRTGTLVHLSSTPQKAKHKVGYYSTRMVEDKMTPFNGEVRIAVAA